MQVIVPDDSSITPEVNVIVIVSRLRAHQRCDFVVGDSAGGTRRIETCRAMDVVAIDQDIVGVAGRGHRPHAIDRDAITVVAECAIATHLVVSNVDIRKAVAEADSSTHACAMNTVHRDPARPNRDASIDDHGRIGPSPRWVVRIRNCRSRAGVGEGRYRTASQRDGIA